MAGMVDSLKFWNWGKKKPVVQADFTGYNTGGGQYRTLFSFIYNGEKNLGEVGPPKDYIIDFGVLRVRSWQMFIESDMASIVLSKFCHWVIGRGLRLQCEPAVDVLGDSGVSVDAQKFSKSVEARFRLFCRSRNSTYSKEKNLFRLQRVAMINAKVGGDALVIIRYDEETGVNVQVIDGAHVVNPLKAGAVNAAYWSAIESNGNRIENGIELNKRNEHIAYYVRKAGTVDTTRVPAIGPASGMRQAYMVYGSEYRIDDMRGLPLISVVIETIKKLERYKEATVGSAEELAKIVYQVVHQQYSTGESPLNDNIVKAFDADKNSDLPTDTLGNELANTIRVSTNKQAVNNPRGAEIKTINSNKYQLYFKDFFGINADMICAAVRIPPDVAFSKYNANYSASRAAIKDWEHTLLVERDDFGDQFMRPIFEFWFRIQVLSNKINAPGYLQAWINKDYDVLEAYHNSRWAGTAVPHIDPEKEVKAERLKLGESAKDMPLTTLEASTEALNGGEADSNMTQFAEELKESKALGIKTEEPQPKPGKPAKQS